MAEVTLAPQRMDLRLYAGDGAILRLTFTQAGEPLPMDDGAITAHIRVRRTDEQPVAVFAVDADDSPTGVIILSLHGDQTRSLMDYFDKERYRNGMKGSWDIQWNPEGRDPVTIIQGDCYCDADVTR
jgi:hypothetical protein